MVINLNQLAEEIKETEEMFELFLDNRYLEERESFYSPIKFKLKTILVKRKKIKNRRYNLKRKYRSNSLNPLFGLPNEEIAKILSLIIES